jgi:hypothetical protein
MAETRPLFGSQKPPPPPIALKLVVLFGSELSWRAVFDGDHKLLGISDQGGGLLQRVSLGKPANLLAISDTVLDYR